MTRHGLVMLKRRAEFLRIRNGLRHAGGAFVVEAKSRHGVTALQDVPPHVARFGLTVTKQLGNAVVRNRVRRRLRHALRAIAPANAVAGFDYVLIARSRAASDCFERLAGDLAGAFAKIHRQVPAADGAARARPQQRKIPPS